MFGWIWGIFNNVWIALFTLVPFVNIVMHVALGLKGSEWAWRYGTWENVEHFRRTQKNWDTAGLIYLLILIMGFVVVSVAVLS